MPYTDNMPGKKENYTFRFDPDLIARIDAQAAKEQRSRTNMMEVMASEYLAERLRFSASPDTARRPTQE